MRLAALVVLLLAFPAGASAAPFGELPFRPVTSSATCLRATGAPGELIRWVKGGVELLALRPDGFVAAGTVPIGTANGCPAVAGHAGGAAVLAATSGESVRVALREPGGGWGAPVTLEATEPYAPEVAINARGDAIVLWTEYLPDRTARVRGARRPAGGPLGSAETFGIALDAAAAVTGAGETFVLVGGEDDVRLTSAPVGVPFPPARRLLRSSFASGSAIAAAADGRVLAAVGADDGLVVFEREPGGDLVRRPIVRGSSIGEPEIVLRDDGAAVVSWGAATAVTAMVRTGPGAFGAPVTLTEAAPPRPNRDRGFGIGLIGVDEGDPPYEGQSRPRATLGADGRALLGWGIQDAGVRAATVTAAGQADRQTLATAVRDQDGITPLVLADGRRAVAWTDNAPIFSVPPYAGRLHLALEDAPAPAPVPAPELRVGAPRDRSLRPAQALLLPVRCSAACDVRATLDDDPVDDPGASLASAGTAWLRFRPSSTPIAPRRPGTVRVVVRWSAPGSSVVRSRTERVRLRRLPPPRLPRILGLRARRLSGGRVEVRWRTDAPTVDAYWFVYGSRVGDPKRDGDVVAFGSAPAGDRRSFRVVLRDARSARHALVTLNPLVGTRGRRAAVRIP